MCSFPMYAGFVASKQESRLIFPSPAVLWVVRAAEVIFRHRVKEEGKGITGEQHLGLKIQTDVLEQPGPVIIFTILDQFT